MSIVHSPSWISGKPYNSVPREAVWKALIKLGIPETLIKIIVSFQEGLSAQIFLNGRQSESDVKVDNGLRQGCSMLFILYAYLGVEERIKNVEGVGVLLNHRLDRMLFSKF